MFFPILETFTVQYTKATVLGLVKRETAEYRKAPYPFRLLKRPVRSNFPTTQIYAMFLVYFLLTKVVLQIISFGNSMITRNPVNLVRQDGSSSKVALSRT